MINKSIKRPVNFQTTEPVTTLSKPSWRSQTRFFNSQKQQVTHSRHQVNIIKTVSPKLCPNPFFGRNHALIPSVSFPLQREKNWCTWRLVRWLERLLPRQWTLGKKLHHTNSDVYIYMLVSKNRGTPKWMVKIMENPIKVDDLGVPLFSETSIYLCTAYVCISTRISTLPLQIMLKLPVVWRLPVFIPQLASPRSFWWIQGWLLEVRHELPRRVHR